MPGPGVNLRERVVAHLESTKETNSRRIAEAVAESLTPQQRLDALLQCLTPFVHEVIRAERTKAFNKLRRKRCPEPKPKSGGKRSGHDNKSKRFQGLTGVYAVRVSLGDRMVLLGDCTREDVLTIVAEYERRAGEQTAWADRFRALAATLQRTGAERVRDVPEDAIQEALGAAEGLRLAA